MRRGEVYDAEIDPVRGSEQAGRRPVIVVSRDSINEHSTVVIVIPCTTHRGGRIYPSQVLIHSTEGGFVADTIALGEQVRAIDKARLVSRRGDLSPRTLRSLDRSLLIALDLPGQP